MVESQPFSPAASSPSQAVAASRSAATGLPASSSSGPLQKAIVYRSIGRPSSSRIEAGLCGQLARLLETPLHPVEPDQRPGRPGLAPLEDASALGDGLRRAVARRDRRRAPEEWQGRRRTEPRSPARGRRPGVRARPRFSRAADHARSRCRGGSRRTRRAFQAAARSCGRRSAPARGRPRGPARVPASAVNERSIVTRSSSSSQRVRSSRARSPSEPRKRQRLLPCGDAPSRRSPESISAWASSSSSSTPSLLRGSTRATARVSRFAAPAPSPIDQRAATGRRKALRSAQAELSGSSSPSSVR